MDKEVKENKRKFDYIRLGFAQMRVVHDKFDNDKADNVGWRRAYILYSWIWSWQIYTKIGFGKVRKKDVYEQIEHDLIEPKPHIVVSALIRAGLVTWGRSEYEGRTNYCLQCTYLNESNKNNNNTLDEEAVVVVESAVPCTAQSALSETEEPLNYPYSDFDKDYIRRLGDGLIEVNGYIINDKNGEYFNFFKRCRMYIPNPNYPQDVERCFVGDRNAPPRPTPTAVWWDDGRKWMEPKDIPSRPLDF